MKWSFAAIGIFILGVIGVSIIFLFQAITTNNENDYYLLKEVTEAAMIESIDIPYYRETGDLKIVKEKFVENFTRRFAESTIYISSEYKIKTYDVIETPPKVSVIIDTGIGEFNVGGSTDEYKIQNKLDAILEYIGKDTYKLPVPGSNPYVSGSLTKDYYMIASLSGGSFNEKYSLKLPAELIAPNIKNIKIEKVEKETMTLDQGVLGIALLQNELLYNNIETDYSNIQYIGNYSSVTGSVDFDIYNCGISTSEYNCDSYNKYYVSISGSANEPSKEKVLFKYKVTWSYDEYKFS